MEEKTSGGALEAAGEAFDWAWKHRDAILKRLKSIFSWFRSGDGTEKKPGILLLGAGGTGKTTLAQLLAGNFDCLVDPPGRYEESIGVEIFGLKDDPKVEIVVPPGQHHRRESTWNDLHADIVAGRFRGVILISSFGFHSLGEISYKDHRLYQGNKAEFLDAYLAAQRDDELAVLRQLTPHLQASRGRLWLLSVVTKQDLWWPQQTQVEEYYRDGDYGATVQQLVSTKGGRDFRHELAYASLIINNFVTGRQERLRPNAEGYDHNEQVKSVRHLFQIAEALMSWEANQ